MKSKENMSMREMIREAYRQLDGFSRNREIKKWIKARWKVEPTDSEIWNAIGSEKSRVMSKSNVEQKKKAGDFLASVFWDLNAAKQLLELVRWNYGE
jgi:hypothetical protein